MNLFKSKTLSWWEISALKLALFSLGIVVGAEWGELFLPYTAYLGLSGLLLGIYVAIVWVRA